MSLAYPSSIKVQLLERVGRGETVRAVCAEPGMPCEGSIQVWRRADPGFAGELAAARARGDWRRRLAPFDRRGSASEVGARLKPPIGCSANRFLLLGR